jgi:hypothetical protein
VVAVAGVAAAAAAEWRRWESRGLGRFAMRPMHDGTVESLALPNT